MSWARDRSPPRVTVKVKAVEAPSPVLRSAWLASALMPKVESSLVTSVLAVAVVM
jgi:hypothetical protein